MAVAIQTLSMPWDLSPDADARFQRILRYNLIAFLFLGLLVPWLPLPQPEKNVTAELPPRMAKLLLEPKPVPPPSKPEPVILKPKPQTKPEPSPEPVKSPQPARQQARATKPAPVEKPVSARQQAEQSGLLALKDTLSDLRQNSVTSSLRKTRELSQAGGRARTTERALLTAGTTSGSDGIQTAGLSRNAAGTALATRTTTRVHSPAGTAATTAGTGSSKDRAGRSAGRSIEEIQMIFDRNKGAIYSIYNRALRQNPALQGKVVLRLTITPSGKVTDCTVISSELDDAVLGDKIAQRVKLFDFGAQDVNEVTITYPIDFLPA
jgi:TonB family protein